MSNASVVLDRIVFYGFFIFLSLIVILVFSYEPEYIAPEPLDENYPDFMFKDVKISHIDNGELILEMDAKEARIYKDHDSLELTQILGVAFVKEVPTLLFSAPEGNMALTSAKLNLNQSESVFLYDDQSMGLKTNTLLWNPINYLFHGKGNVEIYHKDFKLNAERFRFDIRTYTMTLDKKAIAYISSEM